MNIEIGDYIWTENPKTVFVIEWTGDNRVEMINFLRKFTKRWEVETYSTYEKSVVIKGDDIIDIIPEPWDHLLVESNGRAGKNLGSEVDLLMGYTKGRPNL